MGSICGGRHDQPGHRPDERPWRLKFNNSLLKRAGRWQCGTGGLMPASLSFRTSRLSAIRSLAYSASVSCRCPSSVPASHLPSRTVCSAGTNRPIRVLALGLILRYYSSADACAYPFLRARQSISDVRPHSETPHETRRVCAPEYTLSHPSRLCPAERRQELRRSPAVHENAQLMDSQLQGERIRRIRIHHGKGKDRARQRVICG